MAAILGNHNVIIFTSSDVIRSCCWTSKEAFRDVLYTLDILLSQALILLELSGGGTFFLSVLRNSKNALAK